MQNGEKLPGALKIAANTGESARGIDMGGEKIGENDHLTYRVSDTLLRELGKDTGIKVCEMMCGVLIFDGE